MGGFSTVAGAGWVPRFERYADVIVPAGASYVPASPGIYDGASNAPNDFTFIFEVYSSVAGAWFNISAGGVYMYGHRVPVKICDGANARFRNTSASAYRLVLMRVG
jgi:hypothetical protein